MYVNGEKMKKWIINILIVITTIAIIILGYNLFSKYYFNFVNEKSIEEFLKENFEITNSNVDENDSDINNMSSNTQDNIQNSIPMYEGYKVLGMIKIDKINLSYPIIEANKNKDKALNISIIKFYGNGLNENGNVTLAGHNYYDSTMFAKLHKLEKGDKIIIIDSMKRLVEYVVYDKYNTSPNDTTCLETLDFETKELTLITCTKGNTQRLVIKAKGI